MAAEIRQQYKSRAEAFALFVQPGGYGVSRSKFYEDCGRLQIIQQDKSLFLADLLAYVKNELETATSDARSLADEAHAKLMRDLDRRDKEATVQEKERKARQFDDRFMEIIDHDRQMAAFAGRLEEALQQLTTIKLSELIYLCGGDVRRAAEIQQALEDLYAEAMTGAVKEQFQVVGFAADDVEDEDGNNNDHREA